MADEKVIACYVKWRDVDWRTSGKQFIIMWSDHTWETICCPFDCYYIGDKTFKQHMRLQEIVSRKMQKEEAMRFIQERFDESIKLIND